MKSKLKFLVKVALVLMPVESAIFNSAHAIQPDLMGRFIKNGFQMQAAQEQTVGQYQANTQQLSQNIGLCQTDSYGWLRSKGNNIYDDLIGQNFSRDSQNQMEIDILARTLYAEMGSTKCQTADRKHMYAAAAVIMNRAQECARTNKSYCAKAPVSESAIHDVILQPGQFNVWFDKNQKKALCPVNEQSSRAELSLWDDAVTVASEAILSNRTFMEKTQDIFSNRIFDYFSARGGDSDTRANTIEMDNEVTINGGQLDRVCLALTIPVKKK
jgi:hypothetical protein